ncbi:30S ribosomal protein S16 [Hydrogenibacillus sp. N12]|uniref:30S ribosomal protein S16 n=1 Tax=Hydrogenibacillus sp. N12 TaxID=2866627 RepID=UPI001C7DA6F3|nr:30S ribosomal protein S16 [Hydrogenibacillus sp. N12]QZA33474.1 30S ribosomal protein S16 [Hydrogenibacillus sp. N12]
MVKIRLRRLGAKKRPFYRIVVADARSPRDGRFIEEIGYYNPLTDPADVKVDVERAVYWLKNGAQPTETVRSLFRRTGVLKAFYEARRAEKGQASDAAEPATLSGTEGSGA